MWETMKFWSSVMKDVVSPGFLFAFGCDFYFSGDETDFSVIYGRFFSICVCVYKLLSCFYFTSFLFHHHLFFLNGFSSFFLQYTPSYLFAPHLLLFPLFTPLTLFTLSSHLQLFFSCSCLLPSCHLHLSTTFTVSSSLLFPF